MQKSNILKKNWEFQEIIGSKKQITSRTLILYYRENNKNTRVGISISKKFASAVKRNRLRRQVRSILDELSPWNSNKDLIFILRKPFIDLSFEDKMIEIKQILERL